MSENSSQDQAIQFIQNIFNLARQGSLSYTDLSNVAKMLIDAKNYEMASHLYQAWLLNTKSPTAHVVYADLGDLLLSVNSLQHAAAAFQSSLTLNGLFERARSALMKLPPAYHNCAPLVLPQTGITSPPGQDGQPPQAVEQALPSQSDDPGQSSPGTRRLTLTLTLLSLSDEALAGFASDPRYAHYRDILQSSLPAEPLDAGEAALCELLIRAFAGGIGDGLALRAYLAALMYREAYRLPAVFNVPMIPSAMLEKYLEHMLQQVSVFPQAGDPERFLGYLSALVDHLHDLARHRRHPNWLPACVTFSLRANFISLYFNYENLHDIYRKRAEIMEAAMTAQGWRLDHQPAPVQAKRRIRIGVLSFHFSAHTETYTTLPVFEHLDREAFSVTLFAMKKSGHPMESACEGLADALVALPEDIPRAAELIRSYDLDVLVFGTNISAVSHHLTFLALHRLARVQCTNFCSPVTTGMRHMDYYISGDLTETAGGGQSQYRERLELLKGSGFCFDYYLCPVPPVPPIDRAELQLSETAVVLASGANLFKITPNLREWWARILAAVPDAVLLLYPFGPAWSNSYPEKRFRAAMNEAMARHGVDPGRCRILDRSLPNRSAVKALLSHVDIYLESTPYSGANSNVDPLELAIPIVAHTGSTMRTQQGAAMLLDLGLDELVTGSEDEYVALAVRLARDGEYRRSLRARISARMAENPRFLDPADYGRQMEAAFRTMLRAAGHSLLADQ